MGREHAQAVVVGILVLLSFALLPDPSEARTWRVEKDGSGDFVDIVDAVEAAASGDRIEVGPGIYLVKSTATYAAVIDIDLEIVAREGAESTVLDGDGKWGFFRFDTGAVCQVEGFTFQNGFAADAGGAIRAQNGARVKVLASRFVANRAGYQAGAVHARHMGTSIELFGCLLEANRATIAGAGSSILGATLTAFDCQIRENRADELGGLATNQAVLVVAESVFTGNDGAGGALHYVGAQGGSVRNTYFANHSWGGAALRVAGVNGAMSIVGNLFVGDTGGAGLELVNVPSHLLDRSCNLYWQNRSGAVRSGEVLPDLELVADPLFCDPAAGNLFLQEDSPAADPPLSCSGPIGALPVGCEAQPDPCADFTLGEAHVEGSVATLQLQAFGSTDIPTVAAAMDMRLQWDPQLLEFLDADLSEELKDGWILAANPASDSVRLSLASAEGNELSPAGTRILVVRLRVLAGADLSTTVQIGELAVHDAQLEPICTRVQSGTVHLGCPWGDVVLDGAINALDAVRTLQFVTGMRAPDPGEACRADVDADGVIDVGDAILIVRRAVGLPRTMDPGADHARVGLEVDDGIVRLHGVGLAGMQGRLHVDPTLTLDTSGWEGAMGVTHAGATGELEFAAVATDGLASMLELRFRGEGVISIHTLVAFDVEGKVVQPELDTSIVRLGADGTPVLRTEFFGAMPNPFNPRTEIRFALAERTRCRIEVIDTAGRRVRSFDLGEVAAGRHSVAWDGTDQLGRSVASGVYVLRLRAGRHVMSAPSVLLK